MSGQLKKFGKIETLLFVITLLTGIFVIFYKYTIVPKNISYDEVEFAQLALSLNDATYQVYSPLATGHSTLYFYILMISLKIFGINILALRLPAALFAIGSGILFYLIFKLIFKHFILTLTATFILFTLHWYLNFARFSFEVTFLLFLELFSLYFVLKFTNKISAKYLIISSIFAGFAFHSYYPGKIFFLLPFCILFIKTKKIYAFYYICIVLLIAFPLIIYNLQHPDIRISQISFLTDTHITLLEKSQGVTQNLVKNLFMVIGNGDMNGRHNFPGKAALNPVLVILYIGGVLLVLYDCLTKNQIFYRKYDYIFTIYLILAIIPTLLTAPTDNPNMLRTFTMLPSILYFITRLLQYLYEITKHIKYKKILYIAFFLIIGLSSMYELRTYFTFQSRVFLNSFEVICPLKEVVSLNKIPKKCRVQKNMF